VWRATSVRTGPSARLMPCDPSLQWLRSKRRGGHSTGATDIIFDCRSGSQKKFRHFLKQTGGPPREYLNPPQLAVLVTTDRAVLLHYGSYAKGG
jgi:hypothetical protein